MRFGERPVHPARAAAVYAIVGLIGLGSAVACVGSVVTWHRNRAPVEMSLGDYLRDRPAGEWVRLTGCEVDYAAAAESLNKGGKVIAVYAPARPEGAGEIPGPVDAVVLLSESTRSQR